LVEHWLKAEHLAQNALKAEIALIAIALSLGRLMRWLSIEFDIAFFAIAIIFGEDFNSNAIAILCRSIKGMFGVECFLDNVLLL